MALGFKARRKLGMGIVLGPSELGASQIGLREIGALEPGSPAQVVPTQKC